MDGVLSQQLTQEVNNMATRAPGVGAVVEGSMEQVQRNGCAKNITSLENQMTVWLHHVWIEEVG